MRKRLMRVLSVTIGVVMLVFSLGFTAATNGDNGNRGGAGNNGSGQQNG